jgi:SAM-dependent methyltransferase
LFEKDTRTSRQAEFGFRQLQPLPTAEQLDEFYGTDYYELISQGGRAPEIGRLSKAGPEADRERQWLRETLYTDARCILEEQLSNPSNRRVLDMGSGLGDFVRYLCDFGWDAMGVEPASDAQEVSQRLGVMTYPSLEALAEADDRPFNAVTLLNVLEHVREPIEFLQGLAPLLVEGGIMAIRVPNDFTPIQECAVRKTAYEPWWIAVPDHVNYFDFDSLAKLLGSIGFEMADAIGDFPMEMFLLMGDDYISDRTLGPACHQKRVSFEMALDGSLRRDIYRNLAKAGVGRNCFVFARKIGS